MTNSQDSFLHEAQQEGKAHGKVELQDLDSAIAAVTHIMNNDVVALYKKKPEEDWPTCTMKVYCHDCRAIVSPGMMKLRRGKTRMVCGTCRSKKISKGREDSLRTYYRINDKNQEAEKTPQKENTDSSKKS